MTDFSKLRKVVGNGEIQKGRAMPLAPNQVPGREGYAMPAQAASSGPVSERPGSAVPPKAQGR